MGIKSLCNPQNICIYIYIIFPYSLLSPRKFFCKEHPLADLRLQAHDK